MEINEVAAAWSLREGPGGEQRGTQRRSLAESGGETEGCAGHQVELDAGIHVIAAATDDCQGPAVYTALMTQRWAEG